LLAGHGFLFSSSWRHGLIGMGFVQVGGERERGRIAGKIFKNLLLPCLCIRRGEGE